MNIVVRDSSPDAAVAEESADAATGRLSVGRAALNVFLDNRLAVIAGCIIVVMALFCWVGPLIYVTNQTQTNPTIANQAPSLRHLLGTNFVGYDELGRLMLGGQTAFEIGAAVAVLATGLGAVWGAAAALLGGLGDAVMMRVVDSLLAIPTLFILLIAASIVTPSVPALIVIISLLAWLVPARLVRAEALSLRERDFVSAVVGMGGGTLRILFRHIVPNAVGTIMVNATFQVADAILILASLSFLGLGVPPPATNWGQMVATGMTYLFDGYWWEVFPAGACIVAVVMSFNVVGDALHDAFEVRLRQR